MQLIIVPLIVSLIMKQSETESTSQAGRIERINRTRAFAIAKVSEAGGGRSCAKQLTDDHSLFIQLRASSRSGHVQSYEDEISPGGWLEIHHPVEPMVPEANRHVAADSLRKHDGEIHLYDPDSDQLLLDMFPVNTVYSLYHSGRHQSRHEDPDDRSAQFYTDGHGKAVHPNRSQRKHHRMYLAHSRRLESDHGRRGSHDHAG